MPLTALQTEILATLAGNRSEESHFAGGIVLNAAADSARFSNDFDIFHELAEEVAGVCICSTSRQTRPSRSPLAPRHATTWTLLNSNGCFRSRRFVG